MKDKFLESLRRNGKYSNTVKKTKWYDGIDLTMNQSFKEEYEEVEKPTVVHIWDSNDFILSRPITSDNDLERLGDKETEKFFLPEIEEQESEIVWRRKYGCECCGRKLIFPLEYKWGLCSECDRIMFGKAKARKVFPDLANSVTAPDEIFYKPSLDETIRLQEVEEQGSLNWILNFIKRGNKNKNKRKRFFHPFLEQVG